MQNNVIISVAKKEIMDNIRNKWIIIVSVIFALLTIASSYYGAAYSKKWSDMGFTIVIIMSMVQYLISIIALILGYGTIIAEVERGSMSSLLSLSATRLEIITGKFLGLASVLSISIFVGFGAAGLIIAANVPNFNFVEYLIFIGASILFGLIFLSISLFFSTIFKRRSTAIGGAVFLWFFFLFILSIIFGIILFSTGSTIIPDWYYGLELLNPVSVYSNFVSINVVPISQMMQTVTTTPITYPSFLTNWLLLPLLFLWIIVFFVLAYWRFNKQDI